MHRSTSFLTFRPTLIFIKRVHSPEKNPLKCTDVSYYFTRTTVSVVGGSTFSKSCRTSRMWPQRVKRYERSSLCPPSKTKTWNMARWRTNKFFGSSICTQIALPFNNDSCSVEKPRQICSLISHRRTMMLQTRARLYNYYMQPGHWLMDSARSACSLAHAQCNICYQNKFPKTE